MLSPRRGGGEQLNAHKLEKYKYRDQVEGRRILSILHCPHAIGCQARKREYISHLSTWDHPQQLHYLQLMAAKSNSPIKSLRGI
ncbi:hypothetical protein L211DRAFT_152254 [Terfezia boudieri ATCC MYA-4762]|uniref:Uncharacterized protein n=1 Tax=Terfezia boudieri ATCC MYA-4762 TaxID=1051890 RepID=A0A3N4LPI3_9PEZI|nr:hypothetical protein L211DRAFT_152254 [Terfezia boudieri ATCC MYA-4762]